MQVIGTAGPWVQCFTEASDPLDWDFNKDQYNNPRPMWWCKLTWPQIASPHPGPTCRLKVRVTSTEQPTAWWADYEVTSPEFGFLDEAVFQSIWKRLAIDNEQARRWTLGGGGWKDAGGGYGESRSHGAFLSGLAWLLRWRRPEFTTQECNDLVSAIQWGVDYIRELATPEFDYYYENPPGVFNYRIDDHQTYAQDPSHWVKDSNGSPLPVARFGHLYEDNHTRPGSQPNHKLGWWKDIGNKDGSIFRACNGLDDAALTLFPFDPVYADLAYQQADATRTYLYNTGSGQSTAFDVDTQFRSGWQFARHDYRLLADPTYSGPPYFDQDRALLDLKEAFYLADPQTGKWKDVKEWVLRTTRIGETTRIAIDGLLQAIDRGLGVPTYYGGAPSALVDARDAIIEHWYAKYHANSAIDPFRITKFWPGWKTDVRDFDGTELFFQENLLMETIAVSRLAEQIDPEVYTTEHALLVELGTANFNWFLGMAPGVPGRFITPPSDEERECVSTLAAGCSRSPGQLWIDDNRNGDQDYWTEPSMCLTAHGDDATPGFAPTVPPGTFKPHQPPDGETFILRDGLFLTAAEVLGRVLHPQAVIEAESFIAKDPNVGSAVSNNDVGTPLFNGGFSMIGLDNQEWLEYSFTAPSKKLTAQDYRVLLRLANAYATAQALTVTIDPGINQWSTTIDLPAGPSSNIHDYYILDATTAGAPNLNPGQHVLRLDFPSAQTTVSLDCVVIKQTGSS